MRGSGLLPRNAYPMLVTFGALAHKPTSVVRVDPDDLAATFGEGVWLERIVVRMTSEPVTMSLGERLGRMGVVPNQSLDRDFQATATPTLAQILGYRDFVQPAS